MSTDRLLAEPVPGRLYTVMKACSYVELGLFGALLVFWIAPGFEHETFIFGLGHGVGYIALCLILFATVVRRQAPWPLLAATLTPVGPVGTVVAMALLERRGHDDP